MSYGIAGVTVCAEIEQSLLEKLCKVTIACVLLALSHRVRHFVPGEGCRCGQRAGPGSGQWLQCCCAHSVFGLSLPSCCLFLPPPSFCVVFITIITIFSFLSHSSGPQPPLLAGPNPVGCNPRGAPDTVNSSFTRAAELLQTFLLIFTGLKASPFSLIIP